MSKETILINGHLGTGKTTLAEKLVKVLGLKLEGELDPQLNPYLDSFYMYQHQLKEMRSRETYNPWAYPTQETFLKKSIEQGIKIGRSHEDHLWESGVQNHFMYAWLHKEAGRLNTLEWKQYQMLYLSGMVKVVAPTIALITTMTDIDQLEKRVKDRAKSDPNRASEETIPRDYLEEQSHYYQEVVTTKKMTPSDPQLAAYPVEELKAEEIDWTTKKGLDQVIQRLETHLPSVTKKLQRVLTWPGKW